MSAIIIAIANQKGGVGKTTTALCLAQELIHRQKRVLFIDSDSQCNSTKFYEASIDNQEATLVDILCGDLPADECIQTTPKGDIIPADKLLFDAENMVRVDERRFSHLKRSLKPVLNKYDFIIIDTPPAIGVSLKNVLACAHHIIIPVEESGWALDGLIDFSDAIELALDNNENLDIAGILTIKSKKRTKKSQRMKELAENIAKTLNTRLFKTNIRESVVVAEALTEYYVPLHEYAPNSTSDCDYRAFTDELLEVI